MFKQTPDDIELEILAKIAHDMNNLAGILVLNVELLETHAKGDKVPIYLDKLRNVSMRLRQMSSHLNRHGLDLNQPSPWAPVLLIREAAMDFEPCLPDLVRTEKLAANECQTDVNPWLLKNLIVFGFREICHHRPKGTVQFDLRQEDDVLNIQWVAPQPERPPERLAAAGAFMGNLAELMNIGFSSKMTDPIELCLSLPITPVS